MRYLGLMEVARETGIPYWRIIYAEQAGHLPNPMRIACKRVYTDKDVDRVRKHFSQNTR
jgi:DNA-binding transcriptional MerR regulator